MPRAVPYKPPRKVPIVVDLKDMRMDIIYDVFMPERDFYIARKRSNGSTHRELAEELGICVANEAHRYFLASLRIQRAAFYVLHRLGLCHKSQMMQVALTAAFWCVLRGRCPDERCFS